MDYTVVVDAAGNTVTQEHGGQLYIRVVDAEGNGDWKPVTEVAGSATVGSNGQQENLGIELGPVVEAAEATPTPAAETAETEAQARSRRAETQVQLAMQREARQQATAEARQVREAQAAEGRAQREARQAANEARRQADWDREEAAIRAEEEAEVAQAEDREATEEDRDRDPYHFWLGPLGNWAACAICAFGPAVVLFPLSMIFDYYDCSLGGHISRMSAGLCFWVGYFWFLVWQERKCRARDLRERLDAAAEGRQQEA